MMLNKLRLKIGRYLLEKETAGLTGSRNKKMSNLADAHSIGLLYDATEPENFWHVRSFVNDLRKMNKRVITLGYRHATDGRPVKQLLEYRYFTPKDINWYFKPGGLEAEHFIAEDFDILINLCLDEMLPIQYICGISRAKFKVGEGSCGIQKHCDMLIHVGERRTLDYFISQIRHYLAMLNRPQ